MRFTIYGLYQYDPNLFDDVELPAGIDRNTIIDEIMERSGDLYCYYQVPERIKNNITHWFKYRLPDFERIYKALTAEYSPIENYDRYEERAETPNITRTNKGTNEQSGNNNSSATVNNDVSAYDSSDFSPNTKTITSSNDNMSNRTSYSGTDTETGTRRYEEHTHGNIGVTTNQQMINQELELRKTSIYDIIVSEFESKFLIQVY